MAIDAKTRALARQRGKKRLHRSALPGEPLTRPDQIVDLLDERTTRAAQSGAVRLLRMMASKDWTVIRGAHKTPGGDMNLHVRIDIGAQAYHLRLTKDHVVRDITAIREEKVVRPAGQAPWVAPGAMPPK